MTTIVLPSTTINIPTLMSGTAMLHVNPGSQYNDMMLTIRSEYLAIMARSILEKEMAQVRRQNPDIDLNKIQEMLDSDNSEMRELGISILSKYTKYTGRIMADPDSTANLEFIIEDYIFHNKYNITEEVL